ncbi:MAG: PQQ-dependent sugar dehydrogenase [Planctomycetales bacterium]|nr:PQQ-dependent sugar dehydrogenase [Planctomycetales bacterium]
MKTSKSNPWSKAATLFVSSLCQLLLLHSQASAQLLEQSSQTVRAGISQEASTALRDGIRIPWTTGRIDGTPDPADRFTTEPAFPHLTFDEPVAMCAIPGHEMFCVATRRGKLYAFDNRSDVRHAQLLLDVKKTVYGVAFHPDFENNGYFFITSFDNPSRFDATGAQLSRFQVTNFEKADITASTEQTILTWPSGGHNGGCIRFGLDGYLYISVGDGSGMGDTLETGQDITDLSGSILRIDVDHPFHEQLYSIPKDNPFVLVKGARGEVWSYGHRHVWKFSFDRQNRLWAGDVGQDLWEAVYVVESGGNYGWSVKEANHPFRPNRTLGPTPIRLPIVEHSHSHFRSVTGGYVSYTTRLPELNGAYIYGDYDTGAIWALKYEKQQVGMHEKLADTQLRIVAFAQDADGEVLLVDYVGGKIYRLVPAPPPATQPSIFPRLLSETGLFSSTQDHVPAPGLIPYSVNAPLWTDGASKDRFIALPDLSQIEFDAVFYPHQPDYPDLGWRFPDGSVLVKTFSIALDETRPNELHRLETRILQFRQMPGNDDRYGAQVWNGYTYVWNDEQTDAYLLDDESMDRELSIVDPQATGGIRKQTWHFPSRSECALCHTMGSKYVLGVTTLQMNKEHDYGSHRENQLSLLERLSVFTSPLSKKPAQLPALAYYHDQSQPLHLRARAYLHANCAHCHRKWGGGNADFELQASLPLTDTGLINALPGQGTFNISDPRILVPGAPERSLLLTRMLLQGEGKMPHIGSTVLDTSALPIIGDWIGSLDTPSELELSGAIRPRMQNERSDRRLKFTRLALSLLGTLTLMFYWRRCTANTSDS